MRLKNILAAPTDFKLTRMGKSARIKLLVSPTKETKGMFLFKHSLLEKPPACLKLIIKSGKCFRFEKVPGFQDFPGRKMCLELAKRPWTEPSKKRGLPKKRILSPNLSKKLTKLRAFV